MPQVNGPRAEPAPAPALRSDGAAAAARLEASRSQRGADAAAESFAAHIEVPSAYVAAAETSTLPGEHRGGFQREFTEPVPITASVHTDVRWAPAPAAPLPRSAPWALTFGVLGLIVSFLVGWGFLIGLVGAGLAIVALRRPWESRAVAVWALCVSLLSVLYSAGWLWWASTQGPLFG